jgi:hypothetical protein
MDEIAKRAKIGRGRFTVTFLRAMTCWPLPI